MRLDQPQIAALIWWQAHCNPYSGTPSWVTDATIRSLVKLGLLKLVDRSVSGNGYDITQDGRRALRGEWTPQGTDPD